MPLSRKVCAGTILLAAGYLVTFSLATAAQGVSKTTKSAARRSHAAVVTQRPVTHRSSVRLSAGAATARKGTVSRRSSARRRVASRRVPSRQRLARLRLEPDRVKEIQQALGKTGYLEQEPSGKWDDVTRDAMRRYQADHGFPATGMPEAKSLLKLGLGSHPLPPEVDPTAQAQPPPETPDSTGLPTPEVSNEAAPLDSSPPPSQ
jgi:peptidoglycan hydrolase-like protein with peptidoglycan-binding domain